MFFVTLLLGLVAFTPVLADDAKPFTVWLPGFNAPFHSQTREADIIAAQPDSLSRDAYAELVVLTDYVIYEYQHYGLSINLENDTLKSIRVDIDRDLFEEWFQELLKQLPEGVERDSTRTEEEIWDAWYTPEVSVSRTVDSAAEIHYEFYFNLPPEQNSDIR